MTARAYISLGSNIGQREKLLAAAVEALKGITVIRKISKMYETEPVGKIAQPWFLNMCVEAETGLSAENLLEECQRIEADLGRKRTEKWGPRTVDLDILFYDDVIMASPRLTLPHPEARHRRFVLTPMVEIAPDFLHPILKKPMQELLKECPDLSIVRLHGYAPTQKTRHTVPH